MGLPLSEQEFVSDFGGLKIYFCKTPKGGIFFRTRDGESVIDSYELLTGEPCDPKKLEEYGLEKLDRNYGPRKMIYTMPGWGFELLKGASIFEKEFRLDSIYSKKRAENINGPLND